MEKLNFFTKQIKDIPEGKLELPCHQGDVGYDVYAASSPKIVGEIYQGYLFKNISYIEYETNITIKPSQDEYGDYQFYSTVFPRSSISKYNLSICNSVGVIDSGYEDTIKIRFNYLSQPENFSILESKHLLLGVDSSKIYQKGDKIAQIIFFKQFHPRVQDLGNSKKSTGRKKGGFGSTGKWL